MKFNLFQGANDSMMCVITDCFSCFNPKKAGEVNLIPA